jgi:hypothetical protein
MYYLDNESLVCVIFYYFFSVNIGFPLEVNIQKEKGLKEGVNKEEEERRRKKTHIYHNIFFPLLPPNSLEKSILVEIFIENRIDVHSSYVKCISEKKENLEEVNQPCQRLY